MSKLVFELVVVIVGGACILAVTAQALAAWFDRERAELEHAAGMHRCSRHDAGLDGDL